MATSKILHDLEEGLLEHSKVGSTKFCGLTIEKKIDLLESVAGKVSNRRCRRLINDRLLMELVPRLNGDEIRGLFAPPPWGDDVPPSSFHMTYVAEWDRFRSIDMDKQTKMIDALNIEAPKRRTKSDQDRIDALNAWRRIDSRTRAFLLRSLFNELIEGYEVSLRAFIEENDDEHLIMKIGSPFHRLLLHGVCEYYNLVSITVLDSEVSGSVKVTKISKKGDAAARPNMALTDFLKLCKNGS